MAQNKFGEKFENYIMEMPSLPVSVGKVLEICGGAAVSPLDLNHVISLDPVLTGKLLKLINSAYYGLGCHVTSLVRAVTMLGLNTVKNLALSTAILSTLPRNKRVDGINMEGFWYHCLCVGVTSKLLAAKQGIDSKYLEEYFAAGLLHDIGKIPLNAVMSSDYMQLVTAADLQQKTLLAVENENLGITHCTVGAMIANAWKLVECPIIDVVTYHHDIDSYSGDNLHLLCDVAIADYFSLVHGIGFSGNRKPVKPEKNIWDAIGLNEDSFEELKDKISGEIEKARVFLQVSRN